MTRTVPEWIGKTDDTAIPARVKLRVYEKAEGKCAKCGIDAWAGEYDHVIPIILGGANRESNLQLLCVPCHGAKTKLDVKIKAKVARVRKRHLGLMPAKRQAIKSPGFRKAAPQRKASSPVTKWRGF
jgi:5-methylcytosine-specific restriction endonuclease McrA